jgi:hypothetical protein
MSDLATAARVALGTALRTLRERVGLRLEDLTGACGVGRTALSDLERGTYTRPPPWNRVEAFVNRCLARAGATGRLAAEHRDQFRKLVAQVETADRATGRPAARADDTAILRAYLAHMGRVWRDLDHSFMSGLGVPARSVAGFYVEPHVTPLDHEEEDPVLASGLLDRPGVYEIVGEVGTGKTALLKYLGWRSTRRGAGRGEARRPVPFLIPIGRLSQADLRADGHLFPVAYVCAEAVAAGLALRPEAVSRLLDEGRCLFMFDGLDEADPAIAAALRERLGHTAVALQGRYSGNRMIVTSRPGQRALSGDDVSAFVLNGFSWTDVRHFADRWDRPASGPDRGATPDRSRVLLSVEHPRFRRLMTRPLFLTIVALMRVGTAMEQRDEVFRMLTDRMMLRDADKGLAHRTAGAPAQSQRYRLSHIALVMYESAGGVGEFRIRSAALVDNLTDYLAVEEELPRGAAAAEAQRFLSWCVAVGLLTVTEDAYAFRHLAMQQYFASGGLYRHALRSGDFTAAAVQIIATRYDHPLWTEPVLFLASQLDRPMTDMAVRAVLTTPVPYGQLTKANVLAATRLLAECRHVATTVADECVQALLGELVPTPPAGEKLPSAEARRGAYRESVSLLPMMRGTAAEHIIVTRLVAAVGSGPPRARGWACKLLGVLATDNEQAIDALFAATESGGDPTVQDEARRALAAIVQSQPAVLVRLENLVDSDEADPAARRHAGRALLQLHRGYAATLRLLLADGGLDKGRRGLRNQWVSALRTGVDDPSGTWPAERPAVTGMLTRAAASHPPTPPVPGRRTRPTPGDVARDLTHEVDRVHGPAATAAPAPAPRVGSDPAGRVRYVGKILKVYRRNRAGVVTTVGPLRVGMRLRVRSPETRRRSPTGVAFDQVLRSMEIEKHQIEETPGGTAVGVEFDGPVRVGDRVYVVEADDLHAHRSVGILDAEGG